MLLFSVNAKDLKGRFLYRVIYVASIHIHTHTRAQEEEGEEKNFLARCSKITMKVQLNEKDILIVMINIISTIRKCSLLVIFDPFCHVFFFFVFELKSKHRFRRYNEVIIN